MNKQIIAIEIGGLIRQLRIKKGLSQEELAHQCDLHRTYIGSIERGEKVVTILTLEKIANALDISLSELFLKYEINNKK